MTMNGQGTDFGPCFALRAIASTRLSHYIVYIPRELQIQQSALFPHKELAM
jgi:hypothetical protein